jgi:hypothetical protein
VLTLKIIRKVGSAVEHQLTAHFHRCPPHPAYPGFIVMKIPMDHQFWFIFAWTTASLTGPGVYLEPLPNELHFSMRVGNSLS